MVTVIDGRRCRISQDLRGFFLTGFFALTVVFFSTAFSGSSCAFIVSVAAILS